MYGDNGSPSLMPRDGLKAAVGLPFHNTLINVD
jgi:hypothetical protein